MRRLRSLQIDNQLFKNLTAFVKVSLKLTQRHVEKGCVSKSRMTDQNNSFPNPFAGAVFLCMVGQGPICDSPDQRSCRFLNFSELVFIPFTLDPESAVKIIVPCIGIQRSPRSPIVFPEIFFLRHRLFSFIVVAQEPHGGLYRRVIAD